ncbi:FKBP-type peptidyl-prolyl cis-trans isomerase [Actinomadura sp. 9N407]|uniref:FKBP-type peptidyl-prolyl cis-trans isomerase n=1 Tax=Actinomadura sp. 9N407 TaxID=3375154 RepID=UPI00379CF3D4
MSDEDKPRGERAVKATAKLPAAKNIRSPEFKPHGISGANRSRGPRPSGKTAAQAKKQRRIGIAVAVVAVLAIAGGTTWYVTRPGPVITATGALGQAPKVRIPKDLVPSGKLDVDTAIKGKGHKLATGDTAIAKYTFFQWSKGTDEKADESSNKKLESSWEQPAGQQTMMMTLGKTPLKGLDKGLVGQTAGSRVIIEIPPKDGFGKQGEQLGLTANDSVVFVADLLEAYPKNAEAKGTPKEQDDKDLPAIGPVEAGKGPKVTIPKADPPEKMKVETLIEGGGRETTKDDTAIVKYKGLVWRNGKEFDSSWDDGVPAPFPLASTQGMTGFFKGLQGKKIGSRVLLVLPPKDGYGKAGQPEAGIKGDDHVVFVADILGVMPK